MNLPDARRVLFGIKDILSPYCLRCEEAGGVRREKPDPHDLELVVIPSQRRPQIAFGQRTPVFRNLFDLHLWELEQEGKLRKEMGGDKYRKFIIDPARWGVPSDTQFVKLDLFIVTPETWGVQWTLRTGPADFSHWLVTPKSQRGGLPEGMFVKDGRLWPGPVETPEEIDFFKALGLRWIEPQKRK